MATLYIGSHSLPVKVRNMSPRGALIECGAPPPLGQEVRLCRGSLQVSGDVIWATGGKAGLCFRSQVAVAEWLPGAKAAMRQSRIDEMVQSVKSATQLSTASTAAPADIAPTPLTSFEITQLQLAIESLAEDLTDDADVVARHLEKLQTLDLTAQALKKIAAGR